MSSLLEQLEDKLKEEQHAMPTNTLNVLTDILTICGELIVTNQQLNIRMKELEEENHQLIKKLDGSVGDNTEES